MQFSKMTLLATFTVGQAIGDRDGTVSFLVGTGLFLSATKGSGSCDVSNVKVSTCFDSLGMSKIV